MITTILLFAAALQAPPEAVSAPAPAPVTASVPAAEQPAVLDPQDLADMRGGETPGPIVLTEQNLSAVNGSVMQGNIIGSGDVTFDGAAFSSFDGVGNFVFNTGHQNNIQSSISVNIIMTAPTQ